MANEAVYIIIAIVFVIIKILVLRACNSQCREEEEEEVGRANYIGTTETRQFYQQETPVQMAVISDGRISTAGAAPAAYLTQDYHQYEVQCPLPPSYDPNDPPPSYTQAVSYPDNTMEGWLTWK